MPRMIDVKPKAGLMINVKPKAGDMVDIKPKVGILAENYTRSYSVVQSAGMYAGLPWLIYPTTGTIIQWSETG